MLLQHSVDSGPIGKQVKLNPRSHHFSIFCQLVLQLSQTHLLRRKRKIEAGSESSSSQMKLQCDVCGVEPASVLCCADEAVLCGGCDGRIHSANKLAGKHRRFSLLHPSSRPLPLCDICKEKSGFLFCQEDRAILCRECDLPIHTATVHAGRHSRFLLTGIRLSSVPIPPSTPISHPTPSAGELVFSRTEEKSVESRTVPAKSKDGGGSSISDYLTKMLPGWRVDDFLFDDPSAADIDAGAGFCQAYEAPPVAGVPWFTPACWNSAAPAEAQWRPMLCSEERNRGRRSEEDVSTVPELSQFHCDYMRNSKRSRTSL